MTSSSGATANSTGQARGKPELVDAVDVVGVGERDPERALVDRVGDRDRRVRARASGTSFVASGETPVTARSTSGSPWLSASCRARSRSLSSLVRLVVAGAPAEAAGRHRHLGRSVSATLPVQVERIELGVEVRVVGRVEGVDVAHRLPSHQAQVRVDDRVPGEERDDAAERRGTARAGSPSCARRRRGGRGARPTGRGRRATRSSGRPEASCRAAAPRRSASFTSPIPSPPRVGERREQQEAGAARGGDRPLRRSGRSAVRPTSTKAAAGKHDRGSG